MELSGLLARYAHLRLPDELVRRATQKALTTICRAKVELGDISIKDGVVIVSGSPALRTEIVIHKKKILELLGKELEGTEEKMPTDIR